MDTPPAVRLSATGIRAAPADAALIDGHTSFVVDTAGLRCRTGRRGPDRWTLDTKPMRLSYQAPHRPTRP